MSEEQDQAVQARLYVGMFGITPQQEGEDNIQFRTRVSGILRDNGKLIEAHEVFNDARYEQDGDVMIGVLGAVTQAMQGVDYGRHGESQISDDYASGIVSQSPKQDLSPAEAMIMLMLAQKK